jgi:hypothetical protein
MEQRAAKEWVHVKDIQDGNLIVKITELQAYRPRYSIEVGRANEDNKLIRHFGVFVDTHLGKVSIRESLGARIKLLVEQAESWVIERTQERENVIMQERIDKEQEEADRGKVNTRVTGKTEKTKRSA